MIEATAGDGLAEPGGSPLRVRWLGRNTYRDAFALQQRLARRDTHQWLLLQEHRHVYTLGRNADAAHLLPAALASGADIEHVDRGGDVTYHGPGQLVGYPLLTRPGHGGGTMASTPAYVDELERLIIDVADRFGVAARREPGYPGVWVDTARGPEKIAAIGVRLVGNRTMHGFALNVNPDLDMFGHIVPCGIADKGVTSLAALGVTVSMAEIVDTVTALASRLWSPTGTAEFAGAKWVTTPDDVAPFSRHGSEFSRVSLRRRQAGVVDTRPWRDRKPDFLRAHVHHGPEVLAVRSAVRQHDLVTVCEEAGCPNLSECWADGTATFMVNGERCTRACGFCLVDTRRPVAPDPGEPARVAAAVAELQLRHAVITTVARDDLDDDGAAAFVDTIAAIRRESPDTTVEVLISDCRGHPDSLGKIFDARPDVLNHNIETVLRLQRAARPSAGYTRSLAVLARAADAGLVTKCGLVLGMGETEAEIETTLRDLAGVGVKIVTMGQYLRPSVSHLPVATYWTPDDFERFGAMATAVGIAHAEASPFARSSHHAAGALASLIGADPSAQSLPAPVAVALTSRR